MWTMTLRRFVTSPISLAANLVPPPHPEAIRHCSTHRSARELGECGDASRRYPRDAQTLVAGGETETLTVPVSGEPRVENPRGRRHHRGVTAGPPSNRGSRRDRKSTRLNSSHTVISYAVFCLKKKKKKH